VDATATAANGEAIIWSRLIRPEWDDLSPEAARSLLKLDFEEDDRARMRELAAKNRSGALTEVEDVELDSYCRVGRLPDLMHSKARRALNKVGAGR
jgi:hypothetical protein